MAKVNVIETAHVVKGAKELGLRGVHRLDKKDGVITAFASDAVDGYKYKLIARNNKIIALVPGEREEIALSSYDLSDSGRRYVEDPLSPYKDEWPRGNIMFAVASHRQTVLSISEYLEVPPSDIVNDVIGLVREGYLLAFPAEAGQ